MSESQLRAEELQLLRQLHRTHRVFTNHSATQEIARRLDEKNEILIWSYSGLYPGWSGYGLEITAKGRRTLGVKPHA